VKRLTQLYFFSILFIFTVLAFSPQSYAASYDPSVKYRTIDTENFSIHYPADLEQIAQQVAMICEDVHTILSPKFNWNPWGRTQVLLTDASDVANGMASVLPYNWMYIRVAAPEIDSSLNTFDEWLRLLIMHEYVHILHLDKAGGLWHVLKYILGKTASPNGVTPGWFKEGIAIYEETVETNAGRNRASYVEMIIRTAILQDQFPTIDVAAGVQWKWPGGNTRYVYGGEFLQYLADTYGGDKLYEFTDRVAGSPILFTLNRQARKTFSKVEFETIKVGNRYVKRKKPGTPGSKSFLQLWKDWKATLEKKYFAEKAELENEGVTPFHTILTSKQTLANPTISPTGSQVVFSEATPMGPAELKVADIDGKNERRLKKGVYASQISFSNDGDYIVYSKTGRYKRYKFVYDLYKYDFETKKVKQLTHGKRAKDPDISPDGKEIVCVTQDNGSSRLELFNVEDKKLSPIPINLPTFSQFAGPRFSPDGSMIAVAVNKPRQMWNIFIYDKSGKEIEQVTKDLAVDLEPEWSRDGNYIYFSSDRTGIYNIYRFNLKTKKTEQITNVLTGVFSPAIAPDGQTLVVQYYDGKGYDIRETNLAGLNFKDASKLKKTWLEKTYGKEFEAGAVKYESGAPFSMLPSATTPTTQDAELYSSKKYSAIGRSLLLPRFVLPGAAILDNAFVVSAMTGAADPLKWHNWLASTSYRTDANYLGYSFRYWYNRYRTLFDMGMMNYAADFGNRRFQYDDGTSRTVHLYEKRIRGYGGFSYPFDSHVFRLGYYYEDRDSKTALTVPEKNYLNLGAFAGFSFVYAYNDSKKFAASISRTGGRRIRLGFTVTNSIFGSAEKNEQYIFAGDWREYIATWGRQVLVLRAAGGMTWGDELVQGTFAMGGSLGEGPLAGRGSLYYMPLRGLPVSALSRTRAVLASAEYRFPLISVQRGLGTFPVHLNDVHVGIFADYGNAWNANQSPGKNFFGNFFLSTGLELRGDFVLGYGLPVTGRIGYGIVVLNRDRLVGLIDPLLDHDAKYGMLILQLGTSF
jgi:Tol biopolymer transport system component